MAKTPTVYPATMYKPHDGNMQCKIVHNEQEEKAARAFGFKMPDELWP